MQMYPGAGYKEQHHYKVEKDEYMYKDDFGLSKGSSSSMHTIKPNHQYATTDHYNYARPGPNMHMMKPTDHHKQHHNYGGHYGPNKHGNYSETYCEQEEIKHFHGNNKYDHHNNNFSGNRHNYGRPSYGGRESGGYVDHHNYGMSNYGGSGGYKQGSSAVWDCKGMDD
ncbi:hypothetical protein CASFOL_020954 [Castilleja foliolosa]|uniref:Uncharacterized protein n=1 Tax=Castilleja foliolosa TaxID=1961234 RepID=A0ABD3D6P8_9LAMI